MSTNNVTIIQVSECLDPGRVWNKPIDTFPYFQLMAFLETDSFCLVQVQKYIYTQDIFRDTTHPNFVNFQQVILYSPCTKYPDKDFKDEVCYDGLTYNFYAFLTCMVVGYGQGHNGQNELYQDEEHRYKAEGNMFDETSQLYAKSSGKNNGDYLYLGGIRPIITRCGITIFSEQKQKCRYN